MVPSHYQSQFWLIINMVLWHSPEDNFTGIFKISITQFRLNIENLKSQPHIPGGNVLSAKSRSYDGKITEIYDKQVLLSTAWRLNKEILILNSMLINSDILICLLNCWFFDGHKVSSILCQWHLSLKTFETKTFQWVSYQKFTRPLRGVTVPWAIDVTWIVSGSLFKCSLNH